jgi:SAM-dependent methyltransferase
MLNNSDEEAIHEHDFIFQFLAKLSAYQGEGKALAAYLAAGRDSAVRLRGLILEDLGRDDVSLLEFAAGYGCVSRHLRDVLPQADITACDIHDEAVRFIEDRFRVKAVSSTSDPDKLSLGRKFDIVFALSFFSHMPKESWTRWLRALARHTAPDGEIIFTTHGLRSVQFFPDCQLDADGFWFNPLANRAISARRSTAARSQHLITFIAKSRTSRASTWCVSTRACGGDTRTFTSLVGPMIGPKTNSSIELFDYPNF